MTIEQTIRRHVAAIREIAAKHPARGRALVDPRNYRARKTRSSIDVGLWQDTVTVRFTWPEGLDLSGSNDIAVCDDAREARALIRGRCAALEAVAT